MMTHQPDPALAKSLREASSSLMSGGEPTLHHIAMVLAPMAMSIAKLEEEGYTSVADAHACRQAIQDQIDELQRPRGISWPTAAAIIFPVLGLLSAVMSFTLPTYLQDLKERRERSELAIMQVKATLSQPVGNNPSNPASK